MRKPQKKHPAQEKLTEDVRRAAGGTQYPRGSKERAAEEKRYGPIRMDPVVVRGPASTFSQRVSDALAEQEASRGNRRRRGLSIGSLVMKGLALPLAEAAAYASDPKRNKKKK